jgi:23S rRNA (adenine2503-C2)-methyltransferase
MSKDVKKQPICLTDLTDQALSDFVAELGQPAYRAKQLRHWLYKELASSFEQMGNLPQALRAKLIKKAVVSCIDPVHELVSKDSTIKVLFALLDGKTVEASVMQHPAGKGNNRYTVCVSTQAGCAIGCPFCATGQQGFERNLTPGEIIDQVLYFTRRVRLNGGTEPDYAPNVVFMGMGEPLANYNALMQAIETLNAGDGFNLGARSMTVSTAGLVPKIERFAKEPRQVGLAVSLHAASDALRNMLVPINKTYPLKRLMAVCNKYVETTGRRITFEYILFGGLNDSIPQAVELATLLKGMNCHVNLIAANPVEGSRFKPPTHSTSLSFLSELERRHISCTLRVSKGADIGAGCGQLRSRVAGANKS